MPDAAADLIGRSDELRRLDAAVDGLGRRGAALIVSGPPGIGKSALILRMTGVQSEAHLPFAGLHQLLLPLAGRFRDLPSRQRAALAAAFGEGEGHDPPDRFLVGLAALGLLTDGAPDVPIVVIADDAQWLDRATAGVLAFVARRIDADPVALLIGLRTGEDVALLHAGLPDLRLTGLDDASAAALLDAQGQELAPAVRRRLLADAEGNPLALVELPTVARHLADATVPPAWLPLTSRLEQAFAARAADLDADAQAVLLAAAVNDSEAQAEDLAAASLMVGRTLATEAVAPAVTAMLVELDGDVLRFRHPLVRSAIHQRAGAGGRQAAHAALAEALDRQPGRALWHRAAATVGGDEGLAEALETMARRSKRFGEIDVAVTTYERAATLSESAETRGRRLLLAAECAFEMGRNDIVGRLMQEAESLELGPLGLARLTWLRELFQVGIWSGPSAPRAFVGVVDRIREDGDVELAMRSLFSVAQRTWWAEPDDQTRQLVLQAARRLPVDDNDPHLLAVLAMAAPIDQAQTVIGRIARVRPDEAADPEAMRLVGLALSVVGALDESAGYFAAAAAGLRTQGRLGLLAQTLTSQAWSAFFRGDWDVARAAAGESERLAGETSQPGVAVTARLADAAQAALRGDPDRALTVAGEVEQMALPLGASPILAFAQLARALAALADERHDDALACLVRMFDEGDSAHHPYVCHFAIADLAEAAAGSTAPETARPFLAQLEALAQRTPSPLLHASLRYARPLLASDAGAEALFAASLTGGTPRYPFVRARLLLAYGRWLRRQRRSTDSRPPLRQARDAFEALGAGPWAERARRELRAGGEVSHRRAADARDLLSAQELQVAQMAAGGLTNREIGARLYLSHRTVGAHLYRVFPKLGIASRSQLGGALTGLAPADADVP